VANERGANLDWSRPFAVGERLALVEMRNGILAGGPASLGSRDGRRVWPRRQALNPGPLGFEHPGPRFKRRCRLSKQTQSMFDVRSQTILVTDDGLTCGTS